MGPWKSELQRTIHYAPERNVNLRFFALLKLNAKSDPEFHFNSNCSSEELFK